MGHKPDLIAEKGLQFFGLLSASISHELKNVLAIFNENAGLLEDLTFMADRGKPIDSARLGKMAETLKKQIGRADEILKNMNSFAHTVDEHVAEVDLQETINLFLNLTDRFTTLRGYRLDLQRPEGPLKIRTAPFFLLNFLWLCLSFSMSTGGEEKRLKLVIEETESSIRIYFRQPSGLARKQDAAFPSDAEKELLAMLGADLTVEPDGQEMVVRLSKSGF